MEEVNNIVHNRGEGGATEGTPPSGAGGSAGQPARRLPAPPAWAMRIAGRISISRSVCGMRRTLRAPLRTLVSECTATITRLHHLDVWSGRWDYRVFLLPSTLQVDLAFVPAEDFGARAPTFKLVFGTAVEQLEVASTSAEEGNRSSLVIRFARTVFHRTREILASRIHDQRHARSSPGTGVRPSRP